MCGIELASEGMLHGGPGQGEGEAVRVGKALSED